ncbi:CPBP family intramembrane metalloprotease [Paenibacillus albidus]|nr:CPBP family glutamic-type intramembrane protease [Paenibacillus albidus]MBT2288182.1 CPBP family intramembrane metalloprotease [Paenibacillus albidus]
MVFQRVLAAQLSRYRGASVFINVVLFVVYHFFSPWMAITRIIAIFPMCFIVWRTKNIYVGMAVHVLLNLISSLSQYNLYMG